ncbi:MAG: hypothetical protein Q9181_006336 [Wetmoreana brouardii]
MRTSTILSALLAGGALATPVRKWLEERAIVVDWVTTTTVVWVTEGQSTTAPESTIQPVAVDSSKKQAAVQGYRPHHHGQAHKAANPVTTQTVNPPSSAPAAPLPTSPKPAAPVPEPTTQQQPPATSAPATPPTNSGSSSSSSNAPTNYPADLDTTSDVYKALVLTHHNVHRSNHSADDLQWDDTLAGYAEQTAKTCVWGHDLSPGGGGYGQNIAAGLTAGEIAKTLTGGFYNNEMMLYPGYGNDNPDMSKFEEWGHFSQMLWQSTTKVGCYSYTCSPPGAKPLDCNPSTGQSYLKNTGCGNGGMNAIFTETMLASTQKLVLLKAKVWSPVAMTVSRAFKPPSAALKSTSVHDQGQGMRDYRCI